MSASKFCRNFLTCPQVGSKGNSCHSTGEKQHRNNDPKIQKTQDLHTTTERVNAEEQKHLDVPLVVVFFPESRKKQSDYRLRENTTQKKTQIVKRKRRRSAALQKDDSADGRGKGFSLIMGHRCNIGQKDTNCNSDEAEADRGVPPSSSYRATDNHGKSSSFCSHVESIVTSKLPPGSTLISDRGAFHTNDREKPFACGYCGKSYKWRKGVYRHIMQEHEEKHVTIHTQEKSFTCNQCGMRFRRKSDHCRHELMHTEERLFPCKTCKKSYTSKCGLSRHSKVNKEGEFREGVISDISSPGKPEEKIIQDCILSSITGYCTVVVEKLPYNTGLVKSNIHPFQLEESQIQTKASPPTALNGLATTDLDSPLSCSNSQLVSALKTSSENVDNDVVSESKLAILRESRTSNTTDTKYNQTQGKDYPIKAVNKKRITVVSDIVYEDEVSSPEGSRCSTMAQTLLSSTNSMAAEEVPAPTSRQANNDHATSSSGFSHVGLESKVSSKLPPGSTLVSNRGLFRIKDKEKPYACAYCGKAYKRKKSVYYHIRLQHDEKRYSCEFCGKLYAQQSLLAEHVRVHKRGKPFTCHQCGIWFRFQSGLLRHCAADNRGKSSSFCSHVESMVSWKLPPGSTLISDRGAFHTNNRDKPFACGYCGNKYNWIQGVYRHIMQRHEKKHVMIDTQEKPFSCDQCGMCFRLESDHCRHKLMHTEERVFPCKICNKSYTSKCDLFGHSEVHKEEKFREGVICDVSSPGKTEEKIIQDCITSTVEQLPNNTGLVESNIHPFQLENNQTQTKPSPSTAPSGLPTTDPDSSPNFTNSRLASALKRSSENVYNKVVSESKVANLGDPRTSNTTRTKSNQTQGKYYPTKTVNRKRISIASGIVYEDEVSSPEGSPSSTTAQTLLSSNNSEAVEEVPAPHTRQSNNNHGTSSSGFSYVGSMVSSKLPPGSTLVSDRGVFRIKDKEKPFACAYCGKAYKIKRSVFSHIRYNHDEKRYSCEFCGKRYALQCQLDLHMALHKQENPFTCDQCGKCFRWPGAFHRHKFTHTQVRPFVCKICNKSYKCKKDLIQHTLIHNKEECKGSICNICKKKFRHLCQLKEHMTIHTGEKPFKCSLCDKQFRTKTQLQSHQGAHSGLRKTCSVCGKTVAARSIYAHMNMHKGPTGRKPFECNICGKRFPRKPNLEGHMRSHTGEKPFACGGCDKRFALYSNMMTHKAKCQKTSDSVI